MGRAAIRRNLCNPHDSRCCLGRQLKPPPNYNTWNPHTPCSDQLDMMAGCKGDYGLFYRATAGWLRGPERALLGAADLAAPSQRRFTLWPFDRCCGRPGCPAACCLLRSPAAWHCGGYLFAHLLLKCDCLRACSAACPALPCPACLPADQSHVAICCPSASGVVMMKCCWLGSGPPHTGRMLRPVAAGLTRPCRTAGPMCGA